MAYLKDYDSKVCVAYIYERLHDALDGEDLAVHVSRLSDELAANFETDTGVKIGTALGWGDNASWGRKYLTGRTKK